MKVVLSETATREFAVAVEWWRENRPAAPTLLEDEMAVVLRRLADMPLTGRPVLNGSLRCHHRPEWAPLPPDHRGTRGPPGDEGELMVAVA